MANADERSALDFYGRVTRTCRLTHICGHASYFSNTRHIVIIMMLASTWEIQSSRGRTCPTSHMQYWINLHREPVNRREKKR